MTHGGQVRPGMAPALEQGGPQHSPVPQPLSGEGCWEGPVMRPGQHMEGQVGSVGAPSQAP